MTKTIKKAQTGAPVSLRTGQLKRLGRLSAKNPSKAENVAERMVERRSRVARGKEYLKKNVGKFMPEVPTVGKKGTTVKRAKSGASFPDLNKDGKITKADILKGRGVIAKKGSKVKKAMNGMTTTLAQRSARAARPAVSPESGRRKTRASLAMNPMMKTGGKTKKMMGGGKCRGGCY
jgi:hypothetical protein